MKVAKCEYCPFLDPETDFYDPVVAAMKRYVQEKGCPDEDLQLMGGACIEAVKRGEKKK